MGKGPQREIAKMKNSAVTVWALALLFLGACSGTERSPSSDANTAGRDARSSTAESAPTGKATPTAAPTSRPSVAPRIVPGPAHEKSVKPGINDRYFADPDPAKWRANFETESREIFTLRETIVAACELSPGQIVADVGAGSGLFTFLFAKKVGPTGKVIAVDILPEFLAEIQKIAERNGLQIVSTLVCTEDTVPLPASSVDVIFICDTYHHFEYPETELASLHRALRPNGTLIVIDFIRIPGISRPWILDHVRAGQEIVESEITAAGFSKIDEKKGILAENWFSRFRKN
jgi:SAM-dependent methyltransferase